MQKNKKACEQEQTEPQRQMPDVYYPLHSLLHTLRELETHEDQICTLLTEIQRSGKMTASLRRDLSALMISFPAASLQQEVHALSAALDEAA